MLWVLLFVGIALAGLAVLVVLGLRLWRALTALLDELGTVADQAGELAPRTGGRARSGRRMSSARPRRERGTP